MKDWWKGVYQQKNTRGIPDFMREFAETAKEGDRLKFRETYFTEDIPETQKPIKYKSRKYNEFYKDLVRELIDKWYSGMLTEPGMKWSTVQQQRKDRFKTQKEIEKAIQPIIDFDETLDRISSEANRLTRGLENWPSHPSANPEISEVPFPSLDPQKPQLVYGLRDTLFKYRLGDGYKTMPFMDSKLEQYNIPEIVWSPKLNIAMHSYFLDTSENEFPLRFILPHDWQKRLVEDNISSYSNEEYTEDKFIGMLFVKYFQDKEFSAFWKQPPFGSKEGHIPLFIFGPYHTTSVEKYNQPFFSHFKLFNVNGMMVDLGQLFPRKRFTYAEIRDVMYKLSPQMDASEIKAIDREKQIEKLQNNPEQQDPFGKTNQEKLEELLQETSEPERKIQRLEMFRVDGNENDIHLLIRKRQDENNPDRNTQKGLSRVCFDWAENRGTMEIREFDFESALKDCTFYGSYNSKGGAGKRLAIGVMISSIIASAFAPRVFFET